MSWPYSVLGRECEVIAGQSPDGQHYNYEGDGVPFYQGKKEFSDRFILPPSTWTRQPTKIARANDILMSVRAPVGPVNFATSDICIGRGLAAIRPGSSIQPDFLFYYLLSLQQQLTGRDGAVFPSINKSEIERIRVPVPPPCEQQRVVSILDKAFDNIALARAKTGKNIANARDLFESAMTTIFAREKSDWEQSTFGDRALFDIIDGDRGANYPKKADFKSKGYCLFLNTKNVRRHGFSWDSLMFISKEKDLALRKGRVEPGDVVLTTRGTVGNIGLLTDDVPYPHIRINSGMVILRPNRQKVVPAFLFAFLQSPFFKQQVRAATSGAAQPQLPIRTLVSLAFAFPRSLSKQQSVADAVAELLFRCRALTQTTERRLRALDDLRGSLLHAAFNGDL